MVTSLARVVDAENLVRAAERNLNKAMLAYLCEEAATRSPRVCTVVLGESEGGHVVVECRDGYGEPLPVPKWMGNVRFRPSARRMLARLAPTLTLIEDETAGWLVVSLSRAREHVTR